jgi:hypothetical protein
VSQGTPNEALHLTGPAWRFFETSRSLQPARQVNAAVSPEVMTEQHNYQPCFAGVPDTWDGRWTVLREFVRRWHGFSLGPIGRRSPFVEQEESKLGCKLPPAFREFISFSEELIAQNAFGILRDCYEVTRLEAHSAISFLLQGEGDHYWAVKLEDFNKEDPPVNTYYLEYEKNEFVHAGMVSPSITSSLLGHMGHYLHAKKGAVSWLA